MAPQHIFFDVGNVLVRFDRAEALSRVAEALGVQPDRLREAVDEGDLLAELEAGRLDWDAVCSALAGRLDRTVEPGAIGEAYCSGFTLAHGMIPVLAGLERAGCPAGILSNTSAIHWAHLVGRGFGLLPGRLQPLVLSHLEGHLKPEPEIFEIAARRAGVPPERIFFTDDIPAHVEAARRAGWDAEPFSSPIELARCLERRGLDLGL
jgi:FMN phosphatase YigB (HAD superfamily)